LTCWRYSKKTDGKCKGEVSERKVSVFLVEVDMLITTRFSYEGAS